MTHSRVRRLNIWGACLAAGTLATAAAGPAAAQDYDFEAVKDALGSSGFLRGSLFITHKGEPVFRYGFGTWKLVPSALDRPYNVASASKTYSVVVAMAAMNDPDVDMGIGDLVSEHIPNAVSINPDYSTMTIKHLMAMTSGIYFPVASPLPGIPIALAPSCLGNSTVDLKTCAEMFIAEPLLPDSDNRPGLGEPDDPAAPGFQYAYSGANHTVLALAVLNAVREAHPNVTTFTDVAERYLFNPCNLNGNSNQNPLPNYGQRVGTRYTYGENEWAGGGIEVSLDFGARFAEVLRTGTCGSKTIISANQRDKMQANQIAGLGDYDRIDVDHLNNSDTTTWPSTDDRNYGLGVWLSDYDGPPEYDTYFGIGAFGAHVFYVPELELSGFLMLDDETLVTTAITDSIALMTEILPLIQAQAEANP